MNRQEIQYAQNLANPVERIEPRVGMDLEQHDRFRRLLQKPAFFRRVYTAGEQRYITQAGRRGYLAAAGLFCAKEAAAKALGLGLFGLRPDELEVCHRETGEPVLFLRGAAARKFPGAAFSLSITHSGPYTAATVLAWFRQP